MAVTVLLTTLTFSSCNKDNPSRFDITPLIGTWDADHAEVSMMGEVVTISISEIKEMYKEMTGADVVYLVDATLIITENTINGQSFTLKGNQLTSLGTADLSSFKITFENVSSSRMTLRYDFNGIVEDVIYNKR